MKASAPIAIILVATVGFSSGLIVDGIFGDGPLTKVSAFLKTKLTGYSLSLIKTAELSSTGNGLINEAKVDFGIDKVCHEVPNPNEDPNIPGDETITKCLNAVNECWIQFDQSFDGSAFEESSIDDGICVICKLKDMKVDGPCKGGLKSLTVKYTGLISPATIEVRHGQPPYLIFNNVVTGQEITVTPEPGKTKIPNETKFKVIDETDTSNFFESSVHTSCSEPIFVGLVFDGFEVTALDPVSTIQVNQVVAEGQLNLPHGYTHPESIHIDVLDPNNPEPNNVLNVFGVEIELKSVILDFAGLAEGTLLGNQYADFGITIEGEELNGDPISLIVYNTDDSAFDSQDPDLEVDIGNISIIPHDDNNDGLPDPGTDPATPNDSPNGGKQIFKFNPTRYVNSMVFVDADRQNPQFTPTVTLYDNDDCDPGQNDENILDVKNIDNTAGDKSKQVLVFIATERVGCMVVHYNDSGGVASINLGCPLPEDLIVEQNPFPEYEEPDNGDSLKIAVIVNDPQYLHNDYDKPMVNHLNMDLNHDITLINDDWVDSNWNPPSGTDVIVVSESVSSSKTSELDDINIGILTVEGANNDELKMGTGGSSSGGSGTSITITDNSHFITNQLGVSNGDSITVATTGGNAGYMSGWDSGTNDVDDLAAYTSDSGQARLLVVESGDTLVDGSSADDRRVFFGAQKFSNLNGVGVDIFDRALLWAAGQG